MSIYTIKFLKKLNKIRKEMEKIKERFLINEAFENFKFDCYYHVAVKDLKSIIVASNLRVFI